MGTSTWSDKSVDAAMRDYVPVRIDFDKNAELDHRFMADETGIPLMVVLDSSGTPVKAHVGYLDAEDFLTWLKSPASQVPLATAPATNPG
jgi:thiol:disulfide interchange protein